MKLTVTRERYTHNSTIGQLSIDGEHFCYTLEPPERDEKPRATPEGTYTVTNRFSPKHGHNVPHVENVPGFEEIEIHPGNFPKDTLGCTLVGRTCGPLPDFIGDSRGAFSALMTTLLPVWEAGQPVTITYTHIPPAPSHN